MIILISLCRSLQWFHAYKKFRNQPRTFARNGSPCSFKMECSVCSY